MTFNPRPCVRGDLDMPVGIEAEVVVRTPGLYRLALRPLTPGDLAAGVNPSWTDPRTGAPFVLDLKRTFSTCPSDGPSPGRPPSSPRCG